MFGVFLVAHKKTPLKGSTPNRHSVRHTTLLLALEGQTDTTGGFVCF